MWFISALFFLAPSWALDPPTTAIERAQSLILKKNRVEACAVLRRALTHQAAGPFRTRLRESLTQVSRVFFTDKGQRAFETGQSALFENPDLAVAQLREALVQEDGNALVRTSLAKVYLSRNECDAARAEVAAAREMNPIDGEAAALDLRTLVCQKNFPLLRERVKLMPALDAWQESFSLYLQAQDWIQQGANARAIEALNRVLVEFPKFPEARYHLARAEGPRGDASLRKYVGLCHALTGRDRRTFGLEPRLCANQKEAEDELAKTSVDL